MALQRDLAAAIAVTRFGLGARPGEIASARTDPRGFLADQIRADGADQPQAGASTSSERLIEFRQYQAERQAARAGGQTFDPVKFATALIRKDAGADFLARARFGAATDAGFRERWALFWANHFTVAATKLQTATLVGPFEQEAIRPHVFGPFETLLVASSSHPAMLLYLDQARSIGPDSTAAGFLSRGSNKAGLNENLAREIMELHTVGVEAGYSQADVTEFARAMTGWSIGGLRESDQVAGRFLFRPAAHEPGVRFVMGRRYPQAGMDQALAVMKDLAASPHTAHHLSLKIARHFVADDPPPALVERLRQTWLDSGGELSTVARALVADDAAWAPDARKIKTPYEFVVSAWRATGGAPDALDGLGPALSGMGQRPFAAPSPKGWPEEAETWCAPDALMKRIGWAERLAAQAPPLDPSEVARGALGERLSERTATAIAHAESRPEALALLIMSPEFQRR